MRIASTTQHSMSAGGIAVACFGDSNCRLFLNNDLEDLLLSHFSLQRDHGLLVIGQCIILRRSSFLESYSASKAANDFPSSSGIDGLFFLSSRFSNAITSCFLMGSWYDRGDFPVDD